MPTLWGFMEFNYSPASVVHAEPSEAVLEERLEASSAQHSASPPATPLPKPMLKAATWEYPDDCFYIKMYVLCPLGALQTALGPCHRYDDEKKRGVWAWA